jgi:hypothetical protein
MSVNKTAAAAATALAIGVSAGAGGLYAYNNVGNDTLNEAFAKAGFDSSQLDNTCYLKMGNGDVVVGQPYALIGKTENVNMHAVEIHHKPYLLMPKGMSLPLMHRRCVLMEKKSSTI